MCSGYGVLATPRRELVTAKDLHEFWGGFGEERALMARRGS